MRNGEYDGLPWSLSEFSRPEVRRADAEMLNDAYMNGQPWAPTPESLARDEENRVEARTWLAALDERRKLAASKNVQQIRERQEKRLTEIWKEREAQLLEKRKTG